MFYVRLKQLCEDRHTTPSAIALAAGMSKSNVTNWKNGASPKLDTMEALAAELGVTVSFHTLISFSA